MNRSRSRDDIAPPLSRGPFVVKRYDAPTYALVSTNNVSTSLTTIPKRETSQIDDSVGPGRDTKEVLHVSASYEAVSGDNSVEENGGVSPKRRYVSTGPAHHWYSWGSASYPSKINLALNEVLPLSFPVSENEVILRALNRFHNVNSVDTLLNIAEARQMGSILGLFKKGLRLTKELSPRHRNRGLRSLVSGGYLAYSFGIAPLVSDLQKLNQAQATFAKDLKKYLANLGKPYNAYFRIYGGCKLTSSMGPRLQNMSPSATYRRRYEVQPQAICRVRGVDTNKYAWDALNKLQYVLDRFGSPGPIHLGWELVPFSFVVDWFVDLSRVFNSLDAALTGRSKKVLDISYSERAIINVDEIFHPYNNWTSDWDGVTTVFHKVRYYHRKPVVHPPWVALSGKFGKKQILLTGALLHQLVSNFLAKRRAAR